MLLPCLLLLMLVDDPAKLIERGVAALDANDLAAAQTHFEQATKQAPSNSAAWMLLAQTRAKLGNLKAAADAAAQAERFGGKDPAILQGLANFYGSAMKDPPRAAEMEVRYAQIAPASDTTAWQRVAALYLSIGKPEKAIDAGSRGKARDKSGDLRLILAAAYTQRKDWTHADSEYAEAIRLNPYDENTRFVAAQAHLQHQDFAGAEKLLIDARKIFDKSPQLELTLGVAYYGERNFSKAVDQFLFTMRLAPDLPQPYAFLGRILEHAGPRLPEATERFAAFELRNPGNPLGYLLHAKAIVAQMPGGSGVPAEAQQALTLVEKSLALNEADADAQFQIGVLLLRMGDFAAAANHLERSVQLNPQDSAVHFQLARAYGALGRKEDAARERELHEKLAEQENAPPPPSQERKK